jgi:thiamine-monophosphate kinase
MSDKEVRKDLEKIGEFGLIRLLTERIELKNPSSLLGVGDDAAVLSMQDAHTVVTTDLLTEGIHFDLMYTPLKHLGYKSVVVNLSDVYAMNAIPSQILVSIALSTKFNTAMIEELYEGIYLACQVYGVDLVGGDTSSSLTGLTISITAIGSAPADKLVYRSGAKENDLICVSGDLGGAYMGLQLLEREKAVFNKSGSAQPDLSGYDYILERQLKPEARQDIIELLAEKDIVPTSMIDISDGLSSEILHICHASKKGCNIVAEKVPLSPDTRQAAEEMNLEPLTIAMNGGEDYELLFTVPLVDYDKVSSLPGIAIIGHIASEKDGRYLKLPDSSFIEIMALGWDSLREVT